MSGSRRGRLFVVGDELLIGVVSQRDPTEFPSVNLALVGNRDPLPMPRQPFPRRRRRIEREPGG